MTALGSSADFWEPNRSAPPMPPTPIAPPPAPPPTTPLGTPLASLLVLPPGPRADLEGQDDNRGQHEFEHWAVSKAHGVAKAAIRNGTMVDVSGNGTRAVFASVRDAIRQLQRARFLLDCTCKMTCAGQDCRAACKTG